MFPALHISTFVTEYRNVFFFQNRKTKLITTNGSRQAKRIFEQSDQDLLCPLIDSLGTVVNAAVTLRLKSHFFQRKLSKSSDMHYQGVEQTV